MLFFALIAMAVVLKAAADSIEVQHRETQACFDRMGKCLDVLEALIKQKIEAERRELLLQLKNQK